MAQNTPTPTISDRLKAIKDIAKIDTSEKANKYDSDYIKLSYGVYSLDGTYKLVFKLAKNKINANGTTKLEKELKSDSLNNAMYKLISDSKEYKIIYNNDYAKFSFLSYKLAILSDSLEKAKSEKEKSEKEKDVLRLLDDIEKLSEKAKLDLNALNTELSEKLKSEKD